MAVISVELTTETLAMPMYELRTITCAPGWKLLPVIVISTASPVLRCPGEMDETEGPGI